MAWDASRPVPWKRLVREWLVYVVVMAVLFTIFFRDDSLLGVFAGLLISGPLYLGFGYVLAKLGYQRRSYRELRDGTRSGRTASGSGGSSGVTAPPRPKPAPTKRTGSTSGRPGGRRR